MIINNNMMSMNAHRSMGVNAGGMGKSTEKLSTGQRVNRAADDAAGLYISEKMRSQIRGLNQASRNAQDGISAVQTAEGALDEVHSMLQRMRELTVQAGNDTNQKEDRDAIESEITQLTKEIHSISNKTEFNKQQLLNGDFSLGKKLQVGANETQTLTIKIDSMSAAELGLADVAGGNLPEDPGTKTTATTKESWVNLGDTDKTTFSVTINGETKIISMDGATGQKTKEHAIKLINDAFGATVASDDGGKIKLEATKEGKGSAYFRVIETSDAGKGLKVAAGLSPELNSATLKNGTDPRGKISKGEVTTIKIDVSDNDKVQEALKTIDKAIAKVSKQRSDLGAVQNRLEHTIKNLDNAAENTQSSESRIRDTDMAKEMSKFTKNNILTQASQAMLAQANQLPQQVLQLLR